MRLILSGGLALAMAAPALAQGPAPSGVLRGVVYDSLITRGPLEGAEIWIESTNQMSRSDAAGRFVFIALLPGRYVVTFYHPVLDSAGLSVPPVVVDVVAGDSNLVALATPGPAQAHHLLCPRDPLHRFGSVLGVAQNAVDRKPLVATISAHWTGYEVGGGSVRSAPLSVEAKSDASGHVLLCGVPTDVTLVIRGRTEGGSAGMSVVDLAGRPFARADLLLAEAPVTGTVKGVVRNRNGSLIPRATVGLVGIDQSAQTDDYGRFTLGSVTAGSGILEAHALGYVPGRSQATIRPSAVEEVDIVLGDSVTVLPPVTVEARYEPFLAQVGFTKRSHSLQGHFLDSADVRRTGATRFEEIFRMVPGAGIRSEGSGLVELQRGQGDILNPAHANYCAPSYFIDGVYYPLPPVQTPSLPIVPAEVLAIEIYSNLFSAPPQYQRRDSGCGVILVWTRRGAPKPKPDQ